jgi:hypothetical protein
MHDYDDSLSEPLAWANAEKVHQKIDRMPLLHDKIHWSVARSPSQSGGGNACGVYTALKFAAILKALTDDNLFVINQNAQRFTPTCQMVGDIFQRGIRE